MFQANNGYWYFRYTDKDGKRKCKATGTKDEAIAREFMENFVPGLKRVKTPRTVQQLLQLYMVPEDNPSFIDSKITGRKYGLRHAQEVARNMRDLLALLKGNNELWDTELKKLTRYDCKQIMIMVHDRWGNTDKARATFSQFKVCLRYASEEKWITASPAVDMPDIKADVMTEVIPMTIGDIQTILEHKELFRFQKKAPNKRIARMREGVVDMDYAVFTVLALTGMRRAEVAAMTSDQVMTGIYRGRAFHYILIDKAYKDDKWKTVGLPKWDICRSIPLPELAYNAIEPYLKPDGGRVFDTMKPCRFRDIFNRIRANADADGIEWEDQESVDMLTPHKLRHALNTNLLSEEVDSLLVAEFCSWSHQDQSKLKKTQQRYTHMIASRLLPVSDRIDELFCGNRESNSFVDKKICMC